MKYPQALSKLVDQVHANRVRHHIAIPGFEDPDTRDEVAASDSNIRIAAEVFGNVLHGDALYGVDGVEYDTFDNCREYGLTISVGGWTFNAYEHRNSDEVNIEGTPDAKVESYGPYGGVDKYDTLASFPWRHEYEAGQALAEMIKLVLDTKGEITRDQLKLVAK